MSKIREALLDLRCSVELLEPFTDFEPVKPEVGCFYSTLNDSVIFVMRKEGPYAGYEPGDPEEVYLFDAVVLVGGHGRSPLNGERPGESFQLHQDGYYLTSQPVGPELLLSLHKKLTFDLLEYL